MPAETLGQIDNINFVALSEVESRELSEAQRICIRGLKTIDGHEAIVAPLSILLEQSQNPSEGQYSINLDDLLREHPDSQKSEAAFRENTDIEDLTHLIDLFISENSELIESLGIKDINNLTPYQSVLLATAIVNSYLEYDQWAVADQDFCQIPQDQLDQASGGDPEKLKIIATGLREKMMQEGAHNLLRGGSAICGNFSMALEQVHMVLKSMQKINGNQQLDSIALVNIGDIGLSAERQDIAYRHAYCLVVSRSASGQTSISIVDPTWSEDTVLGSSEWRKKMDYFSTRAGVAVAEAIDFQVLDGQNADQILNQWLLEDPDDISRFMIAEKAYLAGGASHRKFLRENPSMIKFTKLMGNKRQLNESAKILPLAIERAKTPEGKLKLLIMAIDNAYQLESQEAVHQYANLISGNLELSDVNSIFNSSKDNILISGKIMGYLDQISRSDLLLLEVAEIYLEVLKKLQLSRIEQQDSIGAERVSAVIDQAGNKALDKLMNIRNLLVNFVSNQEITIDQNGERLDCYLDEETGKFNFQYLVEILENLRKIYALTENEQAEADNILLECRQIIDEMIRNPDIYDSKIENLERPPIF